MNPLRKLLPRASAPSDQLRTELAAEGVLFAEEGLKGSLTLRNYRARGQRITFDKSRIIGKIAVTQQRLLVKTGGQQSQDIDVPHSDPLRAAVKVSIEAPDRICFAFDAGRFRPDRSGTVEVRFVTVQAAQVADLLSRDGWDAPSLGPQ
jgi:hypothetical protein